MRSAAVGLCLLTAALAACERRADPPRAPAETPAPLPRTAQPASAPLASAPVPETTVASPNVITPDGLGRVRIGMTAEEALAALGPGWRLGEPIEPGDPGACRHIVTGDAEGGGPVAFMVEGGRVTRAEVDVSVTGEAPAVRTQLGVGAGATEADVRRIYGEQVVTGPHQYEDPPARYLDVWARGRPASADVYVQDPNARGLRFVTDRQQRVTTIFGGGPSIQYVEGCA